MAKQNFFSKNDDPNNVIYFEVEKKPFYDFVKRIFDVVVSVFSLILLFPLFLVIAIAIKSYDGGPVFYVSERVGRFGKVFKFYKFRSMCINADDQLENIIDKNEAGGTIFKMKDDPRVTKIGKILRRTSLDELPQLFCILKGEMSFVGPRPPLIREVENYTDFSMQRLSVKGGLTCYWQIKGRSRIDFNGMIRLDLKYIEERSFWTDLKILLLTVPCVIKGDGAY